MLRLCARAESMVGYDKDIEAWAESVATSNGGNDKDRAFALWVIDWSRQRRCSETFVYRRRSEAEGGQGEELGKLLFKAGAIARERIEVEMVRRFVDIWGNGVVRFEAEVKWERKVQGSRGEGLASSFVIAKRKPLRTRSWRWFLWQIATVDGTGQSEPYARYEYGYNSQQRTRLSRRKNLCLF